MYTPVHKPQSTMVELRGLKSHLLSWGEADRPLLVMLHGWMDVAASYQFVVDSLLTQTQGAYRIVAMDWRGFGLSDWPVAHGQQGARSYWFPDYLADLDALLDVLSPQDPVSLVGHSMGGNIVISYAGVRPDRVCSVVNLEGFGMLDADPLKAPDRYSKWLDELKEPSRLRPYPDLTSVAARLKKTNHRLSDDKALYLAQYWSSQDVDGYRLLGDPAHKIMNPIGYRLNEAQAIWSRITAPVLHVEAKQTEAGLWLSRPGEPVDFEKFRTRFACISDWRCHVVDQAGHMLHHDQPEEVAALIAQHVGKKKPTSLRKPA